MGSTTAAKDHAWGMSAKSLQKSDIWINPQTHQEERVFQ